MTRGSLIRFVNRVIPDTRAVARTHRLEALMAGAYVLDGGPLSALEAETVSGGSQ